MGEYVYENGTWKKKKKKSGILHSLIEAFAPQWEKDMQLGIQTVVAITRFDTDFKNAVEKAKEYGYRLINMTQSQNIIGWMETKRTLIFEKV